MEEFDDITIAAEADFATALNMPIFEMELNLKLIHADLGELRSNDWV